MEAKQKKYERMDYLNRLTDIELLALMIAGEADNQPLPGKVAVACVPIERLRRRRWGATLREVLLQPYQFSTFNDGHWQAFTQRISAYTMLAELAIGHLLNTHTNSATHYCRYDLNPMPKWTSKKYSFCLGQIGDHLFYVEK